LEVALELSGEILRNIEMGEIPTTQIALKASRLARLLNEFDVQRIFEYEAGGYPTEAGSVPPESWRLAVAAGRKIVVQDPKTKANNEYVYTQSITELEEEVRIAEASLGAARDRDVSISSANPQQYVWSPGGNYLERMSIRQSVAQATQRLASRGTLIHRYALRKHYELKFSGVADEVFSRIRDRVDASIGRTTPDAIQRFAATHDNLRSENPEDWSNAVHSCRRILVDLADAVFAPRDDDRVIEVDGKKKTIRLGHDQYVNRIMAFVEGKATSRRFREIVGSHLAFLGDRLDSITKAAQKGSHDTIVSREEADRYVVYTYLVVGDVLALLE
jgi:hypothetical protein